MSILLFAIGTTFVWIGGFLLGRSSQARSNRFSHAATEFYAMEHAKAKYEARLWKNCCQWLIEIGATSHGWNETTAVAHADQKLAEMESKIRDAIEAGFTEDR